MAEESTDIAAMTFEQALEQLDTLVQTMEEGRLPLEESVAAYTRAKALAEHCRSRIDAAQARLSVLEDGQLKACADAGEAQ